MRLIVSGIQHDTFKQTTIPGVQQCQAQGLVLDYRFNLGLNWDVLVQVILVSAHVLLVFGL